MKKTFYILVVISFLGIMNLKAQSPVVTLQHAGTTQVFYGTAAFTSAYTASVSGDTIVLSAGTFTSTTITKQLKIIGSGCYTDSVTLGTTLTSNIFFYPGSEYSSLEGVICNTIYPYASNIQIIRCYTNSINFGSSSYTNDIITGNIITSGINFNATNVTNAVLNNNIFVGNVSVSNGTGVYFTNNTFITNANYVFNSMTGCYFKNNAIYSSVPFNSYPLNSAVGCTFDHNLFSEVSSSGANFKLSNVIYNGNTFITNYYPVATSSVFTSTTGSIFNYSFGNNYHILNSSFLGTDNTEVGMYGGTTPFEYRAIPTNPQIISISVANQTDSNGNLPVNIEAKAQTY